MLDDYKETQKTAYNIMVNEIKSNNISHAYLFDENGNSEAINIVKAFIKSILCNDYHILDNVSAKDDLCRRIDNDNYPELKIIEPEGNYIKKQQIVDLQHSFSRMSIEGERQIYIIKDCDKMRAETANSMLKFLEEPSSNIIAILMTNNYNNILPTIISRCQVIKLNGNNSIVSNDEYEKVALNFLYSVEKNKIATLASTKELWFSFVPSKDRDLMTTIFDIMVDLYYDAIKIKMGSNDIKYIKFISKLQDISSDNNMNQLLEKINCILEYKDRIKFNVNSSLLIDSLIVNIGGNYGSSWC